MSFHEKIARVALQGGNTPGQFTLAAQRHANSFWLFLVAGVAVWYLVNWRWSLIPFSLAALRAFQSVSATLTARRLSQLMSEDTSHGDAAVGPVQFDLNNREHLALLDDIRDKYSALLANRSSPYAKCMYRPASLLPYPKQTIDRALSALLDYVEGRRDSAFLDESIRTPAIAAALQASLDSLADFLDIAPEDLPTDPRQNVLVGSRIAAE